MRGAYQIEYAATIIDANAQAKLAAELPMRWRR